MLEGTEQNFLTKNILHNVIYFRNNQMRKVNIYLYDSVVGNVPMRVGTKQHCLTKNVFNNVIYFRKTNEKKKLLLV